ncbi:hypothetical protein FRC02_006781 [Tulasnella sp. 418]|nr:hypothetical protein FRC02_006781 [Tulasnella sp. 418]
MLLSTIFLCLLAPLAVLAKITLTSFSYSKGVAHMVVRAWPDGPPTYNIWLTHGSDSALLQGGVQAVSGPLDLTLPSDVPPRSGYRIRLASAIYGSDETYYTTKPFTVQQGDFASATGTSTSATVSSSSSTGSSTSSTGSESSSTTFTAITLPNGSVTSVPVTFPSTASTTASLTASGPVTSFVTTATFTDTSLSTVVTTTITAIGVSTTSAPVPTATSSGSKQFPNVLSMLLLPFIGAIFVLAL